MRWLRGAADVQEGTLPTSHGLDPTLLAGKGPLQARTQSMILSTFLYL